LLVGGKSGQTHLNFEEEKMISSEEVTKTKNDLNWLTENEIKTKNNSDRAF
jgi:uncharacterized protein YpmS